MTGAGRRWIAAAFLAPLVAACAAAVDTPPPPAPGSVGAAEFEAIFHARADSARMRFTPADVRFMQDMMVHHAQAVEMAQLAPERAASASVRTLAARILNGQTDEIALMETWLRERAQPLPDEHAHHHHPHGAAMAGMLSPAEMRELAAARGAEFDRLFLQRMIQHHRGAVEMVRTLFASDGAGQDEAVFRFASDVQVDQATEIARMERMLAADVPRGAAP
jgi:uncharacterized protein (DUF305 family)